jgi:hypothetical protein
MPVVRKWVAQPTIQCLRVDHPDRYIQMDGRHWQPLFNLNSTLTNSSQVLKCWAQLDTTTLDSIRIAGYLYRPNTGSVDTSAAISFRIYRVRDITSPNWDDLYITTVSGALQPNGYYTVVVSISSIVGATLDGDTTLMIEATAIRSGTAFRDRIYLNHLGVYESINRLRQDVDFLDITKQDE